MTDKDGNLKVPGFGLPLNYGEDIDRWRTGSSGFRHGANDYYAERVTVRELTMISFIDAITEKPNWHQKVFKDDIVNRWRHEAMSMPVMPMTERTFNWCMEELRHEAGRFNSKGFVRTLQATSRCVKSDTLIGRGLQEELKQAVQPLLQSSAKDWHPRSNNQVLNLVHPSLFPLVWGESRILPCEKVDLINCMDSCGQGVVAPGGQTLKDPPRFGKDHRSLWSTRFQWLPSEVRFTGNEKEKESETEVKFTSYINNLQPWRHGSLYAVIEKIIAASIEPWNEVLVKSWNKNVRISVNCAIFDPPKPDWWSQLFRRTDMSEPERAKLDEAVRAFLTQPNRPDNDLEADEDDDADDLDAHGMPEDWDKSWSVLNAVERKWRRLRRVIHPEPSTQMLENWEEGEVEVKLQDDFREQGLQVIVKLASIELSPEKPEYAGGSWHLEGMLNEHIAATAIYYYDVENVTSSRLRFRQEAGLDGADEMIYEQDDHGPLAETFGVESLNGEPAVQEIGSIATLEGRLLVFPNTLQHCVEPFKLLDESKPGHRRFLVLWLVDPHYRIMSTANVPPQQNDWWAETIWKHSSNSMESKDGHKSDTMPVSRLDLLPPELTQMIFDNVKDWPMSLERAKELRLELMDERTVSQTKIERNFGRYNFCEH